MGRQLRRDGKFEYRIRARQSCASRSVLRAIKFDARKCTTTTDVSYARSIDLRQTRNEREDSHIGDLMARVRVLETWSKSRIVEDVAGRPMTRPVVIDYRCHYHCRVIALFVTDGLEDTAS